MQPHKRQCFQLEQSTQLAGNAADPIENARPNYARELEDYPASEPDFDESGESETDGSDSEDEELPEQPVQEPLNLEALWRLHFALHARGN